MQIYYYFYCSFFGKKHIRASISIICSKCHLNVTEACVIPKLIKSFHIFRVSLNVLPISVFILK